MNTDKLMELERKWREDTDDREECTGYIRGSKFTFVRCADELAAALRAEQAVGDEQLARELLASCAAGRIQRTDGLVEVGQAVDAIRRALGTARQSKFGVVPPPNPSAMVKAAYKAEAMRTARQLEGMALVPREPNSAMVAAAHAVDTGHGSWPRNAYRAMLAAAPGGEGEG